jgi:hypothetical protein
MIPEFLKNRIELKFGRSIKYPKDCTALAFEINKSCQEKISHTTLLRFFNLINESCNPRLHTLDVIAQYAGFECWRDVISEDYLFRYKPKNKRVKISEIKTDSIVNIYFGDSRLSINYNGENQFEVLESLNSSLLKNDVVKILRLEYGFPFVCEEVHRNGNNLGSFTSLNVDTISNVDILSSSHSNIELRYTNNNSSKRGNFK